MAKKHIIIVGDSTVATNNPGNPNHGWGGVIHEHFTTEIAITNLAASGRSSKSFIGEGRWDQALTHGADHIFIQFGHNDCPGKGDRETDPKTTFRDNMRKYIDDTHAAKALPLLITPVTRRRFDSKTGNIRTILGPYAEAMHIVAKEKDVPVIDLHAKSIALFNNLGDEDSTYISATPADRTHFSSEGARIIAKLVIEEIPTQLPELKSYIKS